MSDLAIAAPHSVPVPQISWRRVLVDRVMTGLSYLTVVLVLTPLIESSGIWCIAEWAR